ncbi:MAG TPA: heme-binding domain-containing protein [candidate division Zixibacteria bacterium]|nr:heme-binding domain-containing protein [candidate division Zixibacteria bacterium]
MRYNSKRWIAFLILLLVAPAISLKAQDDSTTVTKDQIQHMQDSVFAIINQNYQAVRPIFEHSCFNCHSKFTDYPWYHKLPLVKSLIDSDIKEARHHVDMSDDFPFGGEHVPLVTLRHIKREIEEADMPPWDYRLMHWGTKIEGEKQDSVFQWIDTSEKTLTDFYEAAGIPLPKTPASEQMEEDEEE